MKSTFFTASLLATAAVAQQHNHGRYHKRDNAVVWVTDIDYVTEIQGVTDTVWVTGGGTQITVSPTSSDDATETSTSTISSEWTSSTPVAQPEAATTPAVVAPTPAPVTSSTPTPTPEANTPTPEPEANTPAPEPEYSASPAPEPESSTPAAVPTPTPAPTTLITSTSPVAAPPTPEVSEAPTSTSSSASPSPTPDSSSGGECSEGSPCTGDITFYDTGLGACGTTSTDTESVVALPWKLMGEQSNGNPYCGKTISITYNGKTTTAKVVDKCMGCADYAIDLSPAAFDELADSSVGRASHAAWHFI